MSILYKGKTMFKKAIAVLIAIVLAIGSVPAIEQLALAALPQAASNLAPPEVCAIGTVRYISFADMLKDLKDGDTIKLLAETKYSGAWVVDGINVTIDLNYNKLSVTNGNYNGVAVLARNGGSVSVTGEGEFNASGDFAGASVETGGRLTVTNATGTGTRSAGAYISADGGGGGAASAGAITVRKNAKGVVYGAAAMGPGSISIGADGFKGGATGQHTGAHAENGGSITVAGDASGDSFGAVSAGAGSRVIIGGDAKAQAKNARTGVGAQARDGGLIEVAGDAVGVSVGVGAVMELSASGGPAWQQSSLTRVTVQGYARATGKDGIGVSNQGGFVAINSEIQADVYIEVPAQPNVDPSAAVVLTCYDYKLTGPTGDNIFEQFDGHLWFYYEREPGGYNHSYTVVKPSPYVCSIGAELYEDLTIAFAAVRKGETIKMLKNFTFNAGLVVNGAADTCSSFTINLNGFRLNINNPAGRGLLVTNNGNLGISGKGELNVRGTTDGVEVRSGGKATVTTATGEGAAGYTCTGVRVALDNDGSSVTVKKGVRGGFNGISVDSKASVTVGSPTEPGYVIGEDNGGVVASLKGKVEVFGDVTGRTSGVWAGNRGTTVKVSGDVKATGERPLSAEKAFYGAGVFASYGARVTVSGNVEGWDVGVYAQDEYTAEDIDPRYKDTIGPLIYSKKHADYTWVEVGGDVRARATTATAYADSGIGVGNKDCFVFVDGDIHAPIYVVTEGAAEGWKERSRLDFTLPAVIAAQFEGDLSFMEGYSVYCADNGWSETSNRNIYDCYIFVSDGLLPKVCEIVGGKKYTSLRKALDELDRQVLAKHNEEMGLGGKTFEELMNNTKGRKTINMAIRLLQHIEYEGNISLTDTNLTILTGEYNLIVGSGLNTNTGLYMRNSTFSVDGAGKVRAYGKDVGVYLNEGSKAALTSAESHSGTGMGCGATVEGGSSLTLDEYARGWEYGVAVRGAKSAATVGDATGNVTNPGSVGAIAGSEATLMILGSATGGMYGVVAQNDTTGATTVKGGTARVEGDASGGEAGALAKGAGASVVLGGSAYGEDYGANKDAYGAMAQGGAKVTLDGDAVGKYAGAGSLDVGSNVIVKGDAEGGAFGAVADINATIRVDGDATGTGPEGIGAFAQSLGQVTVGGSAYGTLYGVAADGYAYNVAKGKNEFSTVKLIGSAYAESASGTGAFSQKGGNVTVSGSVASGGWGVAADGAYSKVTIAGDVAAGGSGAVAQKGGNVAISGSVSGEEFGAAALDAGSKLTIAGDVTADDTGALAQDGGSVTVSGSVSGVNYGVVAVGEGSKARATGNVYATGAGSGTAVHAEAGGVVTVKGSATGADAGAILYDGGEVTIDGRLTAPYFIVLDDVLFNTNNHTEITTKRNYLTYTDADLKAPGEPVNTVWVKGAAAPPAKPAGSMVFSIPGEQPAGGGLNFAIVTGGPFDPAAHEYSLSLDGGATPAGVAANTIQGSLSSVIYGSPEDGVLVIAFLVPPNCGQHPVLYTVTLLQDGAPTGVKADLKQKGFNKLQGLPAYAASGGTTGNWYQYSAYLAIQQALSLANGGGGGGRSFGLMAASAPITLDYETTLGMPPGPLTFYAYGLPPGLGIDRDTGLISGVPREYGEFSFTVIILDRFGDESQMDMSVYIEEFVSEVSIDSADIPEGAQGSPYGASFIADGGDGDYTWVMRGLPAGLSYDVKTGAISGAVAAAGHFPVFVYVEDGEGNFAYTNVTITIKSASLSDYEAVLADAAALTWSVIKGANESQGAVTRTLALPASGANGTQIQWTSDNQGVVIDIDGAAAIKRPQYEGEDASGAIHAVVRRGAEAEIVSFALTVPKSDTPEFVPVTNITGVQAIALLGNTALSGAVLPSNATNSDIIWSIKDDGGTGAAIAGNTLTVGREGTVVLTATIEDGLAPGEPYTQDFTILCGNSGFVCEVVGGLPYADIAYALAAVPNGGTIRLLTDIIHTRPILLDGKAVNISLGDYDLTIDASLYTSGTALYVRYLARIELVGGGTGQFNIKGGSTALRVEGGSHVTAHNVECYGTGVYVSPDDLMINFDGFGVGSIYGGASAVILGDVSELGSGTGVLVAGALRNYYNFTDSWVVVHGNVTAGEEGVVVLGSDNPSPTRRANIWASVGGDVITSGGGFGVAVNGGTATIGGNVTSGGGGVSARQAFFDNDPGIVTVEGMITAGAGSVYIRVSSVSATGGEKTINFPSEHEAVTTKEGYYTFTNGFCTVWVREIPADDISDAMINTRTGVQYSNVQTALEEAQSGDTLRLLRSVRHLYQITITSKTVIIDTDGYTLTIDVNRASYTNSRALQVIAGGKLLHTGEGEININTRETSLGSYRFLNALLVTGAGSEASVNHITMTGGTAAVQVENGAKASINGDITAGWAHGINLTNGSEATITGNICIAGRAGIYSMDSNVVLNGNIYANVAPGAKGILDRQYSGDGLDAGGNSNITVNGSIFCSNTGVRFSGSSTLTSATVNGDVTVYGRRGGSDVRGVAAGGYGKTTVTGNITVYGATGIGVNATYNGSAVEVGGDVTSQHLGVYSEYNENLFDPVVSSVTIDGVLTAGTTYIAIAGNRVLSPRVDLSRGDHDATPAKAGYLTYSRGGATVCVKDGAPFVPATGVTGVPDSVISGLTMTMAGEIQPSNATAKIIKWEIKDRGTTLAQFNEEKNQLHTKVHGKVVMSATVIGGLSPSEHYRQDFVINVVDAPNILTGVTVLAPPHKLIYTEGETLDLSGLRAKAVYVNGIVKEVFNYIVTPEDGCLLDKIGSQTVTISYTEGSITVNASFTVKVLSAQPVLTGIELTKRPDKVVYIRGETLNLAGMAVTARYADGSEKDVTAMISAVPASGFVLNNGYTQTVTLTYSEGGASANTAFSVNINDSAVDHDYMIVETGECFNDLRAAFDAVQDGQTVRLLRDSEYIRVNGRSIAIFTKVTFDLNGKNFTYTGSSTGSELFTDDVFAVGYRSDNFGSSWGDLTIMGPGSMEGSYNHRGSIYSAYFLGTWRDGTRLTITGGAVINMPDYMEINIGGDYNSNTGEIYISGGSSVSVGLFGIAGGKAVVSENSVLTASIYCRRWGGTIYPESGGEIHAEGNTYGVRTVGEANVVVTSAKGGVYGVHCGYYITPGAGGKITVIGDVTSTRTSPGLAPYNDTPYGVYCVGKTNEVTVGGNIYGGQYGVYVDGGGKVTVDGAILGSPNYIRFYTGSNISYVIKSKEDYNTLSSKPFYLEYSEEYDRVTDSDYQFSGPMSFVWIRGEREERYMPPVITGPAAMELPEVYVATSTGVYSITGTAPIDVSFASDYGEITWNSQNQTIDIAVGLAAGSYTVTLTATNEYGSRSHSFTLTVDGDVVILERIKVTTPPGKLQYTAGDNLDLTGMIVTAYYSDLSEKVLAAAGPGISGYTTNPASGARLESAGARTVTVSYTEGGITRTDSFSVEVTAPPSLSGPESMTLAVGYAEISTSAYTVTGTEPVTVSLESDYPEITWNGTEMTLCIAEGLEIGEYTVTLTASNGIQPDAVLSFTLKVTETPVAPEINGPTEMTLQEGYIATRTSLYVVTGTEPIEVGLESDYPEITWNGAIRVIEIAEGLSAGTFAVTLTAANGGEPDATLTFVLTVTPKPAVYYTVTFDVDGKVASQETVESGNKTPRPDDPLKAGSTFNGWRTGSAEGELYDFDLPVFADLTLYASFTPTQGNDIVTPPTTTQTDTTTDDTQTPLSEFTPDHIRYIFGYPDDTVGPDRQLTRAEMCAMLFRLLANEEKKNEPLDARFPDVKENAWYYQAVTYLASIGIVSGYTDGSFRPDAPITRAEFVTMVSRFTGLELQSDSAFTDIAGHWAESYILDVASRGWILGYPDKTFKPQNALTRAEAATIINRMLDRRIEIADLPDWKTSYPDLPASHWAYADITEASTGHEYDRLDNGYEHWTGQLQ